METDKSLPLHAPRGAGRYLRVFMANHSPGPEGWHTTTIIMVKKGGRTVIGGDGQGISLDKSKQSLLPNWRHVPS